MLDSDADRRNMLLALGDSRDPWRSPEFVIIREQPISAIYDPAALRVSFDDVQMSGNSHSLQCLWSDVQRYSISIDDAVTVPDVGDFYIADIGNENGMALITLRKS